MSGPRRYSDAMRFVSDDDVRRVFTPQCAYDSQRAAFEALGSGAADLAPRLILAGDEHDALAFCYAARLRPGSGAVCKFGAVANGRPVIAAICRAAFTANSGCVLSPVPTAVPPSAYS